MSTNSNEAIQFTDQEAQLAASQEETERLNAENQHLKNRVVLLRALVNRLNSERSSSEEDASEAVEPTPIKRKAPADRRAPQKRTQKRPQN